MSVIRVWNGVSSTDVTVVQPVLEAVITSVDLLLFSPPVSEQPACVAAQLQPLVASQVMWTFLLGSAVEFEFQRAVIFPRSGFLNVHTPFGVSCVSRPSSKLLRKVKGSDFEPAETVQIRKLFVDKMQSTKALTMSFLVSANLRLAVNLGCFLNTHV